MRRAHLGAVLGPAPVWAGVLVGVGAAAARVVRSGGPAQRWPQVGVGPRRRPHPGMEDAAWLGGIHGPIEDAARALLTVPRAGGVVLVAAVTGAMALGLLVRRYRGSATCPTPVGVLAVLVVAAVAWSGVVLRADAATHGTLPRLAAEGGAATLDVTVVAEPRPIASGWQVIGRVERPGPFAAERAAFVLEVAPPALGDRLTLVATARPLPEGGYGDWLAQQHARVSLDVQQVRLAGPGNPAARATEWLRARVRAAATRHLDDRHGGLLVGFVTGDTRLLPVDDRAAMQATSLTHLTAVSGTNVAIVIAGVLGVAGVLRLGVVARRVAVAAVVPWFALLTRFEPSVLRAGTMALLLLLASTRGQLRDARHALSVAVVLLVLIDPRLAGSLGLLLSATATAGVLVLAPALRERLPARLPRRVATLLSVTLGAQIAVLPALLVTFGELSLASVPANLLAVPAAIVAATLSFTATAVAVVSVEVAAVLFALAGPGAAVVLTTATALAEVGWRVELARPATVVAVLAAVTWVLAARGGGVRTGAALATILALGLLTLDPLTGGLRPAGLQVTAIDVGQGDAYLVESPGARVLVDAGEDDRAARWLARNGRRHLDLVVVTHPHLDHVGGVPEVLGSRSVGALWWSPLPTQLPAAAEALRAAEAHGVPVRVVHRGARVRVGDLDIEVLHPPPGRPHRWARSELNESSTVLRIEHAGARLLLTGDIEAEAQADLLAGVPDRLHAEVLAVPHHGSATTDVAFLAHVGPRVALISAGQHNRHGHPDSSILAALDELGAEVRRTDLEGTVTVEVPVTRPDPAVPNGIGGAGPPAARAPVTVRHLEVLGGAPPGVPGAGRPLRTQGDDEGDGEDGRLPAVPPYGHTGADPGAVLAGRAGHRGRGRGHDDHRGRPGRPGDPGAGSDRGPGLRGAAHRAVPDPHGAAAHGPAARAGRRWRRQRAFVAGCGLRASPGRLPGRAPGTAAQWPARWATATGSWHPTTTRWLHLRGVSATPAPRRHHGGHGDDGQ